MGQATFSNNSTIKVSSAISASVGSGGTTLYTAPSNGYAIITATVSYGGASSVGYVQVAGITVLYGSPTATVPVVVTGIYVGPSQSVFGQSVSGGGIANIFGVQFINSP